MELVIVTLLILIALPTTYAAIIGAPLALTNKSRIGEIIKITKMASGETFYELGTGTGRVITAFTKRKDIEGVGYELSPLYFLFTILNLRLHDRKNSVVHFANFFNANLEKADVVFCFLVPKTMEKLREKFTKELKPTTKIISFAFPIKNWKSYEEIHGEGKPVAYFYKVSDQQTTSPVGRVPS